MQQLTKTYMRTLNNTIIGIVLVSIMASCGGGNNIEAKKAELEKLKVAQAEIATQIATLEEEIAKSGDSTTVVDGKRLKLVALTEITPSIFTNAVDVQGRVEGDENVTIYPKQAGSIVRIYARAGSHVKAGQVIAEIENDAAKAQLNDLKTNLELAKQMFEKQKSLWEQKVGTEMQYLQAKTNKESLEAKLAQAQELLDMYQIKSPINGTVDEMPLKVGQLVSPAAPVGSGVRVVNLGALKIKADLSESYAGSVQNGNKTLIRFPDINKTTESHVAYAGKVIDPLTRTFSVEIALPASEEYHPNMVAELHIINYKKENAIVVPINTVQHMEGKRYVFVGVKNGKSSLAQKREVKVGKMYNGKAEILEGLTQGDMLITTGYMDLSDNEAIKY